MILWRRYGKQRTKQSSFKRRIKNEELKDASRKFKRVYAFRVSQVNPDFVSFKVWILGYYSKVCSIAVSSLPKIVAQLDTALAEGECEFEIGGIRFSADEKLLGKIRKEFSSYCCLGASDANHAQGASRTGIEGVNPLRRATPRLSPRLESPTGSPKQKASAPACKPSARQISNEELRTKNEKLGGEAADTAKEENNSSFSILNSSLRAAGEADFIAQSAPQAESANGADASAVADGLIQAFREALRAELAPIREALDGLSFKVEELAVFSKGNSALPLPESSFPRTRRGRTSVVVGVRKISTQKTKIKTEDRRI